MSFDSIEEAAEFLGVDKVVLSKFALITKYRADGTPKYRLIWDFLRSEVNEAIRLNERIVLPRLQDAVVDALCLLREHGLVEWAVLDIQDAFHNILVRRAERRYTCGQFGGKVIVFFVLCMGGKSSPSI